MSDTARKEGLLALEETTHDLGNPYLEKGIRLVVDGLRPGIGQRYYGSGLTHTYECNKKRVKFWEDFGCLCSGMGHGRHPDWADQYDEDHGIGLFGNRFRYVTGTDHDPVWLHHCQLDLYSHCTQAGKERSGRGTFHGTGSQRASCRSRQGKTPASSKKNFPPLWKMMSWTRRRKPGLWDDCKMPSCRL